MRALHLLWGLLVTRAEDDVFQDTASWHAGDVGATTISWEENDGAERLPLPPARAAGSRRTIALCSYAAPWDYGSGAVW